MRVFFSLRDAAIGLARVPDVKKPRNSWILFVAFPLRCLLDDTHLETQRGAKKEIDTWNDASAYKGSPQHLGSPDGPGGETARVFGTPAGTRVFAVFSTPSGGESPDARVSQPLDSTNRLANGPIATSPAGLYPDRWGLPPSIDGVGPGIARRKQLNGFLWPVRGQFWRNHFNLLQHMWKPYSNVIAKEPVHASRIF